jgi:hypothetical protein
MIWNNPQIRVGDLDLLYSGTVVVSGNNRIKITPVPAATRPFYVEIVFNDNAALPNGVNVVNTSDNGVTVTLTNFALLGATSTTQPLTIGNLNGAPVLLSIMAYPIFTQALVRNVAFSFFGKAMP